MRAITHILGRILRLLFIGLLLLSLLLFSYVAIVQYRTSQQIAIHKEEGIQVLEKLSLGGVHQWISIRGEDRSNPLLLFLHGGPGASEMVPLRYYNQALEQDFVVVSWDQRGTGKSFSREIDPESMSMEQIIEDTLELTRLLRERFEVERIFLAGHSWGSIIGLHAIDRSPEYYKAYIGIGQAVNFREAEEISYQFTLRRAEETGNERALLDLKEIDQDPYVDEDYRERIGVQREWLFAFGGEVYKETNNTRYLLNIAKMHLFAPEYSFVDLINSLRGSLYSLENLWDDLLAVDLPLQVPKVDVPVYFFTGRHDYVTVFEKVEEYYHLLEAPYKEMVWFEKSAHSPNYEEPDSFYREMVRVKDEVLDY